MEKRIALFGGSFNPIHKGHVNTIKQILDMGLVDEVWILPCRDHSFNKRILDGDLRIKMIELAVGGINGIKISREELDFKGKSYTYDTIKRFKKKFPQNKFYFICGNDILYEFEKWYKYEELLKEIDFIVVAREGFDILSTDKMNIFLALKQNVNNVSSTEIRNRIKKGESLKELISFDVLKYIEKNDLYRN